MFYSKYMYISYTPLTHLFHVYACVYVQCLLSHVWPHRYFCVIIILEIGNFVTQNKPYTVCWDFLSCFTPGKLSCGKKKMPLKFWALLTKKARLAVFIYSYYIFLLITWKFCSMHPSHARFFNVYPSSL